MNISIWNRSTVLTDAEVEAAIPAFKKHAANVAAGWHVQLANLSFNSSATTPNSKYWQIVILDDADQAGALGYHELNPVGGLPLSKVFAKTDQKYGASWTVTLTHELAEMLVDPFASTAMQDVNTGNFWALEVCDPCEDDSYGYTPSGTTTLCSDFILPAWFPVGALGLFDYKGHITKPLGVLTNGYAQYFSGNSWHQVNQAHHSQRERARV